MKPLVSIIMGSTSDLPIMEKACKLLDEMQVPFEVNALSAHRTPDAVEEFARTAKDRGIKVIIAGAGMAAALPGVIAASTTLPVIGVPIKGMLDGLDAMHPRGHSRHQWCTECGNPRYRNDGPRRCCPGSATGYLQRRFESEDRTGQQGSCRREIRV